MLRTRTEQTQMNTANKQQPEVGDDSDSDRPLLKERPDDVQLWLLGRSAFGDSFFFRPSGFSRLLPFRNGETKCDGLCAFGCF